MTFKMPYRGSARAFRVFRQSPRFALAAVVSLAIGIGFFTMAASYEDGLRWRALPYPASERLIVLEDQQSGRDIVAPARYESLEGWASRQEAVEAITGIIGLIGSLDVGERRLVSGTAVSADYFGLFGVPLVAGRLLRSSDEHAGAPAVALISERLWRSAYGSDPTVIGRPMVLERDRPIIVGVVSARFVAPLNNPDYWVPLAPLIREQRQKSAQVANAASGRPVSDPRVMVIGRIRGGESVEQAVAILRAAVPSGASRSNGRRLYVSSLRSAIVRGAPQNSLFGIVAFSILLIACGNVGCLFLVRQLSRTRELALRSALGASTGHLMRQVLGEMTVLGMSGAVLGGVLTLMGIQALRRMPSVFGDLPPQIQPHFDARTFAILIVVGLVCVAVLTVLPVRRVVDFTTLRTRLLPSNGLTSDKAHSTLYRFLVVAELGGASLLAAVAGIGASSYRFVTRMDFGFDPRPLLSVMVIPRADPRSPLDAAAFRLFAQNVRERIASESGVKAIGTWGIPTIQLTGGMIQNSLPITLDRPASSLATAAAISVDMAVVADASLFAALNVPIVAGRAFTDADDAAATPVAMVDEVTAAKWWPHENAIGKRLRIGNNGEWLTVVGISRPTRGLFRDDFLRGQQPSILFLPWGQSTPYRYALFYVRSAAPTPAALEAPLRRSMQSFLSGAIADIGPAIPTYQRAHDQISTDLRIVAVLATIGIVLGAVGVFAVVSYTVVQRTNELGLRIALGAGRGHLTVLLARGAAKMVVSGLALGAVAFFLAARSLRAAFLGVTPSSAPAYAMGATVLFLAVVILGIYLPTRRAWRIDPLQSLRA